MNDLAVIWLNFFQLYPLLQFTWVAIITTMLTSGMIVLRFRLIARSLALSTAPTMGMLQRAQPTEEDAGVEARYCFSPSIIIFYVYVYVYVICSNL